MLYIGYLEKIRVLSKTTQASTYLWRSVLEIRHLKIDLPGHTMPFLKRLSVEVLRHTLVAEVVRCVRLRVSLDKLPVLVGKELDQDLQEIVRTSTMKSG